jgi:integrase/recombinase XerD
MAPRKLPKTLTRDEVERLKSMPNVECPTGLRDRAMIELMHRAGIRVGETCKLHLRDVRWKDHELHIRPEVGKGGKEAIQPLDDKTLAWLERWKPTRRRYAAGTPWLFVTLRGTPMNRSDVWDMVARRARRAGIKHTSPHMLRHTFATELLREGFDLRQVQELCRHSDVRTTVAYTHVHNAELSARIRAR